MSRQKCVLLSILIVTIDPSKDTEKYITDNEVVRSNIKLLSKFRKFSKLPKGLILQIAQSKPLLEKVTSYLSELLTE